MRYSNGDLSICVHDVYRVTTCRPGRGHIVAAARLQLVRDVKRCTKPICDISACHWILTSIPQQLAIALHSVTCVPLFVTHEFAGHARLIKEIVKFPHTKCECSSLIDQIQQWIVQWWLVSLVLQQRLHYLCALFTKLCCECSAEFCASRTTRVGRHCEATCHPATCQLHWNHYCVD